MHIVCVGGSDAGVAAALRARELDEDATVSVILADAYPNFSICGLPYWLGRDVTSLEALAHRSPEELAAKGLELLVNTTVTALEPTSKRVIGVDAAGNECVVPYDRVVIATGATPLVPPILGLSELGPRDGVFVLHTVDDARALDSALAEHAWSRVAIVGAGYIGLEVAEALRRRGLDVTLLEERNHVLGTVDPDLAAPVAEELAAHGARVTLGTRVVGIERRDERLGRHTRGADGLEGALDTDCALIVTGVRPSTALARSIGLPLAANGAIRVDPTMRTPIDGVFAAGDCVVTHHRLLGETYLPLGTTAHKQGRIAGENAVGGDALFHGSLGTQVIKVFDLVVARTGLLEHETLQLGRRTRSVTVRADDHKAYYPGASPITVRLTADASTGVLLGVQMVGRITSAVHKRIDTAAAAIFAGMQARDLIDLDLSYTPPLGTPWDPLQLAAAAWVG